jgi:hypothetical protein
MLPKITQPSFTNRNMRSHGGYSSVKICQAPRRANWEYCRQGDRKTVLLNTLQRLIAFDQAVCRVADIPGWFQIGYCHVAEPAGFISAFE